MRTSLLVSVGLALALTAPARADVATPLPGRALTDDRPSLVATNGARTLLTGAFAWAGRATLDEGVVVNAVTGAPEVFPQLGDDEVTAVVAAPAGGWYVATATKVLRVRPDGSVDPAFSVSDDDRVLSLTLAGDTLWLVGWFENVDGMARKGVAAVSAADGSLRPFNEALASEPGEAALSPDGSVVYLTGGWWDGHDWRGVVALDAASGALRGYGPVDTWGTNIAVGPDGTVYASLSSVWGDDLRAPYGVLALDPATLAPRWTVDTVPVARDMALSPAGDRIYLTGVSSVGGQARDTSAAIDTATGQPTTWTAGGDMGAIALSPDGEVAYFGMGNINGDDDAIGHGGVAASTRDGARLGWAPRMQSMGHPAVSADGRQVFIPSWGVGMEIRFGSAEFDETGELVPWRQDVFSGESDDAQLDVAGTAYLVQNGKLAAISDTGGLKWRLDTDGSARVALSPDESVLYVYGSFTHVGGVARAGLAAVRAADGTLLDWAPALSGGSVWALAAAGDTVYVGGSFTAPRAHLAALDAVSGAARAFDPAPDAPISVLRVTGDRVYVAGSSLTRVAGAAQRYVAGLALDGRLVWKPTLPVSVGDLAVIPGHVIIASQYRDSAGNRPLTSWDATTGALESWNPLDSGCPGCEASQLALDPDGGVLHAIGEFYVDGHPSYYLRLAVAAPTVPANTVVPRIVGPATSSTFIACDPGHWSGHPADYTFAWNIDGGPIPDSDTRQLLLTEGDVGHQVTCEVHAGPSSATSAPVTVTYAPPTTQPPPRRDPLAVPAPTPTPTASPTATAVATATPTVSPPPAARAASSSVAVEPAAVRVDRPDLVAPRVMVMRDLAHVTTAPVRVSLSERAVVTATLAVRGRTTTRRFTLAAGRHTLTARQLSGRAKLRSGRYTLTLRVRDAAGNATPARMLRFSV